MRVTADMVNKAYDRLTSAMVDYSESVEEELHAKQYVERMRAILIRDGKIDGRNAEIREAQARELLQEEYDALETWEIKSRDYKLWLDIARLEVERVRLLVRLDEIEGRVKDDQPTAS